MTHPTTGRTKVDYFGEWSTEFDNAHGRGIVIDYESVRIGYYQKGKYVSGKVIFFHTDK